MAVKVKCTNPSCGVMMTVPQAGQMVQCTVCRTTFYGMAATGSSKPWYLQWYVLAGGGVAALLLLLLIGGGIVAAVMMFGGSTEVAVDVDPQPIVEQPVVPIKKKPTGTLALSGSAAATMEPGTEVKIEVEIESKKVRGRPEFTLEGLPEHLTVGRIQVRSKKVVIPIKATAEAPEGVTEGLLVAVAGELRAEHAVSVHVKKVLPPAIAPIAATFISPGAKATINLQVDRRGLEGPVKLTIAGVPKDITATLPEIDKDKSGGELQLVAAATVPDGKASVRITAEVDGRVGELEFPLTTERYAMHIKPIPLPVRWLKPGESKTVDVTLIRRSYKGPVDLQVEGLPDNVAAQRVTIPENQDTGTITLVATADAKDRVRSAYLVASGGPHSAKHVVVTRVKKQEGMLLPEVGIDPELKGLLKRGSFGGRLSSPSKQALMDLFGGTTESEQAVLMGLRWLSRHQAENGSWSLQNYNRASSKCNCKTQFESEVDDNNVAATAFGLLPFLGAGVTSESAPEYPSELGDYKEVVSKGLEFLKTQQKESGQLPGGMYAHAFGTIALCEAYALTKDRNIQTAAQKGVRYLVNAQHGGTGGWGYGPKQEGDTSVLGWVFLAIRSGQLAKMNVPTRVRDKAGSFLNSTASGPTPHAGSQYSYRPGQPAKPSTSAAGLLSRQYLGWKSDRPELVAGAEHLMKFLPPEHGTKVGAAYTNYYATQVLHHLEGKNWDWWNHRMREHLLRVQEKEGHQKGSFSPEGCDHGKRGGRLYATSLSLLTLEVYYRHLPLYGEAPAKAAQN